MASSKRLSLLLLACVAGAARAAAGPARVVDVAPGWANNSVNAVVFRKNSLVSDGDTQYIAFYDKDAAVVLGKRKLGTRRWTLRRTPYRGNAADAHNSISIMVDGAHYLHLAWDVHNQRLRYARSTRPGGLELTAEMPMLGRDEDSASYPEFFRCPDGGLLFLYRDGGSGHGNLVMNRYDVASAGWTRLHSKLIGGEGQRSAYWQAFVDSAGTIHLSWVWRESPDVASNHDMAYARSRDGGLTWERSNGERYTLPITADSAEYAARIPQNSELINQTSMAAGADGQPVIASYWRAAGSAVPQYHLLYRDGGAWRQLDLDFRRTPFSLSGLGTKAIPVSRPQIMVDGDRNSRRALLVFRDAERGSKVSVASIADLRRPRWTVRDLGAAPVGAWEPSFDTELWRRRGELHLFVQDVPQLDGEGASAGASSPVQVWQWKP
ncbi:BNR repeat-containing protein [Duganella violaceipulchra]|uniref:BNR repeat-containing protein n=1 Tax=Duganella violaceipulchra TaxID=2849652 RepID=A0AA41H8S1_9BURK|nr:BNR repeat-containing protein [Duganella violaceicalia]MCP2008105.1 hypothetical protein [Duganella violaceicalia]